jgi:hypothetical protein
VVEDTGYDSPEFVDRLIDINLEYLLANRDLLSIVFMEDIKNGKENVLMRIWEEIYRREKQELSRERGEGDSGTSMHEMVTLYFYNFMPLISFLVFGDSFSATFGISKEGLDTRYRGIAKRLMDDVLKVAQEETDE